MQNNYLTDTHFHLTLRDDIPDILKRAKENGINNFIISACDLKSIQEGIEIINKYPVYLTIGLHPDEISEYSENTIFYLEELIKNNPKIIGIGEIGLDYYHNKENKKEQIKLFKAQLDLAKKLDLPVVIHSRDAYLDTFNILSEYDLKVTIHCFSGSFEVANSYIKRGYLLGIGGVSTFSNTNLTKVLENIPTKNIVLETDSPYLSPVPLRGKINEPKNIRIIATNLCNIKNISMEELTKITNSNIKKQYKRLEKAD